ncbi:MAG: Flp pilus assembly complex ATPase component TadA, partial [Myxococcales bacterium]|nr:Flp pilus assembly complex ATPase component TadA [Myxococcales bacterium]
MDPRSLPIYRYEDEIVRAVRDHRVVVIEGPTGSGKTTQLPKILLHAGLSSGIIGVTQPRRIAAVSVAWRLAEEMGVEL